MNRVFKFLFYENNKVSYLKLIRNFLLLYICTYYYFEIISSLFSEPDRGIFFKPDEIGIILILIPPMLFWGIVTFLILLVPQKIAYFLFVIVLITVYPAVHNCINPICYLNPIYYPFVFLSFVFLFKNSKYFNHIFIIFLIRFANNKHLKPNIPQSTYLKIIFMKLLSETEKNQNQTLLKATVNGIKTSSHTS